MSEIKDKIVSIIIDKLGVEAAEVTNEASFTTTWVLIHSTQLS